MKGKRLLLGVFIAVMVISIAASCIHAEEKVDLKLRLEKGQSYKMKVVQDIRIIQTVDGKQETSTSKIVVGQIYNIEEVDTNGNTWVKLTYYSTSVKDGRQEEGQPIVWEEYDSSNTSQVVPPDALGLAALAGQSYSIMVSPKGHVKDLKGVESLQSTVMEKIPALPEGNISFGLNQIVKEHINKEALNEIMENKFAIYPDRPVGIGDTWQKRIVISHCSISNLFPQIVDTIYTFKERKNGIATIDVFAMIQPNLETQIELSKEGRIQFKVSGNSTGTIELDESTGWVIRSNQTLRLNGQAILSYPQLPQGTMVVPISLSGTITQEPY